MSAVLAIRPSSLGDIVYALAIVTDIRRHRPDVAIDWVAERAFVPLVRICPDVRRIVPFGLRRWRRAPFDRATWQEIDAFRRELRSQRYAAILDMQEQMKGAIVARTARGRRHGFDRSSSREPISTLAHDVHHRVARNLHFVQRCRTLAAEALGYRCDDAPRWNIVPPTVAPGVPERRFAVALSATSRAEKLWPEDRWQRLIDALARLGYATVLPWGSPDEEARARRIADGRSDAIVPGWLSLPEAATFLMRADVAIGIDTGFTHLAAALGTPTVGLFFATDPVLHGVAIAGPHATDLGSGHALPDVDDVVESSMARARDGHRHANAGST